MSWKGGWQGMAKVPLTNFGFDDIRNAIISIGGSVPVSDYGLDVLAANAISIDYFEPEFLRGATSLAEIDGMDQFRGYPRDRWGNEERSGNFQKQCSGDGTGSWHTYTVPANTYYSFESQEAANTMAQNDVSTNGQAHANGAPGGYCTWYNDEMSATYWKEGCGHKGEGSSYYHTLPAGSVSSTVGKAQANADGQALMNSQGQSWINSNGYCTWRSEARTASIQRANCGDYGTGSYVSVSASEDQFSSTTSLAAANTDRDSWMQGQANANGSCSYSFPSEARSANIQKEGCGHKGVGSWVYVSATSGQFTSSISIADANSQRDAWMQGQANANGYCTWYSEARVANIQRDNCGAGETGSYVSVSASEDQFSSTTSLAAANAARDSWMQGQANANGSCTPSCPNPALSISFLNMASNVMGNYAVTITNASGRTYNMFAGGGSVISDDGNGNIIVQKYLGDAMNIDVFFYAGGGCGVSGITSQDIGVMEGVPHNGYATPIVSQNKYCVDGGPSDKAMLTGHSPNGGTLLWSNGMTGSPILVGAGSYRCWGMTSSGASYASVELTIGIC